MKNEFSDVPFSNDVRRSIARSILEKTRLSNFYGDGKKPQSVPKLKRKPDAPKICAGCEKQISITSPEHLQRKSVCEKCFSLYGRIEHALNMDADARAKGNFLRKFGGKS
jgi:hypothetical protein